MVEETPKTTLTEKEVEESTESEKSGTITPKAESTIMNKLKDKVKKMKIGGKNENSASTTNQN